MPKFAMEPLKILAHNAVTGEPLAAASLQASSTVGELRRILAHELAANECCHVKLLAGTDVLDEAKTLQDVGLSDGAKVAVVRSKGLDGWSQGDLHWWNVNVPLPGSCEAEPVGRDRLLLYSLPPWNDPSAVSPDSIKSFLLGINEPATAPSLQPLELPLGEAPVYRLDFKRGLLHVTVAAQPEVRRIDAEGKEGDPVEVVIKSFELLHDADITAAQWVQREVSTVPVKERQYSAVLFATREFLNEKYNEDDESDTRGTGPYGATMTKYDETQGEEGRRYIQTIQITERSTGKEVGSFQVEGHPNSSVQGLAGGDLCLMAGREGGEDAFYNNMRLVNWRTGEVVREVPLGFEPSYIEVEWSRGLLIGSTETFYVVNGGADVEGQAQIVFCSPHQRPQ